MNKYLPLLLLVLACQKSRTQTDQPATITYAKTPQSFPLSGTAIRETSGIADSKSVPGHMWVQEDSGNPPRLYLLKHDGSVTDSVLLDGATNRDWEDLVLGAGPVAGKNYLYIGDIGDNNAVYGEYTIYRLEEPTEMGNISNYERIRFDYSDGARDAEAMIVDNESKDIYIITKREEKSRLYRLPYPQSTTAVNHAELVDSLGYSQVTSAALSADGLELIVKTYPRLFYYTRKAGESIAKTLEDSPVTLAYQIEPQGEAVTFAADQSGFFTLSEEAMGVVPVLNYYKRNK